MWIALMKFALFSIFLYLSSSKGDNSYNSRPIIHWYAPFYSGGGYCSEAISFISILSEMSYPLYISQHGDSINEKFLQNMRYDEKQLLDSRFTRNSIAEEISICHSEPGAWSAPFPHYHTQQCPPSNSGYKIGRTMFETNRIPTGWVNRLNFMDEIWVPTEFARQIFLQEGVDETKLQIIPEPIDTDFFSMGSSETAGQRKLILRQRMSQILNNQNSLSLTESTFLYLFIGKWEYRKGVQLLLRAFLNEFSHSYSNSVPPEGREDIALTIVTSAYHSTNDFFNAIIRELLSEQIISPSIFRRAFDSSSSLTLNDLDPDEPITKLLGRVVLLTDVPQEEMPTLYQLSNILVVFIKVKFVLTASRLFLLVVKGGVVLMWKPWLAEFRLSQRIGVV